MSTSHKSTCNPQGATNPFLGLGARRRYNWLIELVFGHRSIEVRSHHPFLIGAAASSREIVVSNRKFHAIQNVSKPVL